MAEIPSPLSIFRCPIDVEIRSMDISVTPQEPRVLLVEDDLGVAQIQLLSMKLAGIAVDRVSTVAEGRSALETLGYTLCIFDQHLPDGHGNELISHIRGSLRSDMPVIVVSGARQDSNVARPGELGATEYMMKPFSPAALVESIKRLM